MIELKQVELLRGHKCLLQDANLRLHHGDKLALVGANGSGKTSLFKLLLGELSADSGSVALPADWRIAHMKQELVGSDVSALDYVLDGHQALRQVEAKMNQSEGEALAHWMSEYEALGGYSIRSEAEKLLLGLGFQVEQLQKTVSDFSGGWQMRLNLARTLLTPSECLLLDEPTNHLDVDACYQLERWLNEYQGTLLLISHDRDFIDACCQGVVHLHQQQLQRYNGNYSAFERQRAERLAQQQQAYEKQQREKAHMQKFVDRFRAKATKAKQAQSRLKAMDRMTELAPAHIDSPFKFEFYEPKEQCDPLLSLKKANLGYDSPVLNQVSMQLHPGSRMALLGANGRGKSTLLKSLAGELPLLAGERQPGTKLQLGFFNQHQMEALDLNASPLVQIQRLSPDAREQDIRNFLGGFNIKGDMATGDCHHFSGGEKARLALALIVWQKPNLLLLDEPTNHLDLDMCHALTVAVQAFSGALILVSHDRHLIRNTVDELMLVDEGKVRPFDGDLDDYRQWLLQDKRQQNQDGQAQAGSGDKKEQRRAAAAKRAETAPLRKALKQAENEMDKLEQACRDIETELNDSGLYEAAQKDRLQSLLQRQGELRKQLEDTEQRWLEAQEALEEAESAA